LTIKVNLLIASNYATPLVMKWTF